MGVVERVMLMVLAFGLAVGLGASFVAPEFYTGVLSAEDGPLEWSTALCLFAAALVCFLRAGRLRKSARYVMITALGGLVLFFGAGEEISWGQRIFGWASGEFWQANNAQAETNLHNLMVGEVKVNRVLFGVILTLVFSFYFMVLPWLYRKFDGVRRLFDGWFIPVPKPIHGWAFAISLVVMTLVPSGRAPELGEFAIGVILALAVVYPQNRSVVA